MSLLKLILAVLPMAAATAPIRTGRRTVPAASPPRTQPLPRRDLRAAWSLDPVTGRLVCRWNGGDAAPGARCTVAALPRRPVPAPAALRLAA
ncbi:hypothetical protein [Methylobacterium dankookense]|uniref:Uncharacterized protein n=1 Tax=Methylobacterium dankookense TaxID=560405 RepID=A0A564G3Z2_9HYPH|nr:hypothetical protein [Methylobacterium dankookense]GJD55488.1 hypothetical protein IFDJLNFL_1374 [Methylobacterium dankookense]VUF14812.1 hypothetical protein MTDSW087_04538 [Methylobacterium dankookense]